MSRWVAMHCGEESQALLENHPNAFLLLTQIALRVKWRDCPITRLKAGQAYVGDWRKAGLHSEMAYRHAKKVLLESGLATFQGTNRGTVASLTGTSVFSFSKQTSNEPGDTPATDKQRASNEPATTNHTDTQIHGYPETLLDAPSGPASASKPTPKAEAIAWNFDDGFSGITNKDFAEWQRAYPAVDIQSQLARADQWLKSNPAKARKSQWRRFVTGWLSRAQERGGDIASQKSAPGQFSAADFKL